jgi:hypothetical protein
MPITRTPIIDDDGTGTTGTVIDNAWKTELYNQIDGIAGGDWLDISYAAGNYTANTGSWTVPAGTQKTLAYAVAGDSVYVSVMLSGTQTFAAPSFLYLALPGVPAPLRSAWIPMAYYAGGTGIGLVQLDAGQARLTLIRDLAGTAWPTVTAATAIHSGLVIYPYR